MSWTKKCATAVMATCAISFACATAHATVVNWLINSTASSVKLSIPDQTVDGNKIGLRNQTGSGSSWTVGSTAFMSGTLATNYVENGSIDFIPGSSFVGINSGNYRPNPAAYNTAVTSTINTEGTYGNTSLAAGVFGAKAVAVDVLGAAVAYIAFRSVNYTIDSAPMPFIGPSSGGTFNTAGLNFGISSAVIDVDGLSVIIVGQLIPDLANQSLTNLVAASTAPGGVIGTPNPIIDPLGRRITIPLNIPISIDLDGTLLSANLTGQIVATSIVPEPSTLMMAGLGLVSLAVCARRRKCSAN